MANISISEIQSVASSLTENDLLLVSKANGDNTFTSVKCSFDTLVKAILPCTTCQYTSAVAEKVDDPSKDYVDFVHTLTKSAYISTDIKNLVGNQYNHRITTFLTLSNVNNLKNTIDSTIVLANESEVFHSIGIFGKGAILTIRIPRSIIDENTQVSIEYTSHF